MLDFMIISDVGEVYSAKGKFFEKIDIGLVGKNENKFFFDWKKGKNGKKGHKKLLTFEPKRAKRAPFGPKRAKRAPLSCLHKLMK